MLYLLIPNYLLCILLLCVDLGAADLCIRMYFKAAAFKTVAVYYSHESRLGFPKTRNPYETTLSSSNGTGGNTVKKE